MNELSSFISACGRFRFTVKGNFLTKCPNPTEYDIYDLMTQFQMASYLHNPSGPAIVELKNGKVDFWIDGRHVTREEGEKLTHNYNFDNKFDSEVLNTKS